MSNTTTNGGGMAFDEALTVIMRAEPEVVENLEDNIIKSQIKQIRELKINNDE